MQMARLLSAKRFFGAPGTVPQADVVFPAAPL
jgi:hypothetical protein